MDRIEIAPGLSISRLVDGMWRLGDDPDASPAHVQAKIEACLDQGLTTMDRADVYDGYMAEDILGNALRARPDPLMDHHETGAALDEVVGSGKVRAVNIDQIRTLSQVFDVPMDRQTRFELYSAALGQEVP